MGRRAGAASLVRAKRQGLRDRLGVEDRRALPAFPIVCGDGEVVGAGLDGPAVATDGFELGLSPALTALGGLLESQGRQAMTRMSSARLACAVTMANNIRFVISVPR